MHIQAIKGATYIKFHPVPLQIQRTTPSYMVPKSKENDVAHGAILSYYHKSNY